MIPLENPNARKGSGLDETKRATEENWRDADANFGQPCTEVQEQKIACTNGQVCVRRIGC